MKKRVLLVEDDEGLASILRHNLLHAGFEVECVPDGGLAPERAEAFKPHVVLLDLGLPGRSGFDLCADWSRDRRFPIIIITARDRKEDELGGFRAGADHYVRKPFDFDTLLARIHAVLRKEPSTVERLCLGAVIVDFTTFTAHVRGRPLDLTHREFDVLRYLAAHANSIIHRDELLRAVWGYSGETLTRSVDKTIVKLRKKIEPDPRHPSFIHTAYGDGYWLSLSPAQERPSE